MPYTKEELQELEFYQNLKNEDEQRYINNRDILEARFKASGSADDGTQTIRDEDGNILVFENPFNGQLDPPDENNKIVADMNSEQLKNNLSINELINREFREL
tara:strand:- start:11037 stop:11345 length:309 start_codon:yes stop_codon:yes gene_type:complete